MTIDEITSRLDVVLGRIKDAAPTLESSLRRFADDRIEAGRLLLDARKEHPARGPKAKTWGEFVAARGLSTRTASNYMRAAEFCLANPEEANQALIRVYDAIDLEVSETTFRNPPKAKRASAAPPAPAPAVPDDDTQAVNAEDPKPVTFAERPRLFRDDDVVRLEVAIDEATDPSTAPEVDTVADLDKDLDKILQGVRSVAGIWPYQKQHIREYLSKRIKEICS